MIRIPSETRRGKYSNAHHGKFIPKHPEKFLGTETPEYKSELERSFMRYADGNPAIVQWGYESRVVKYLDQSCSPAKVRRYYVDFVCRVRVGSAVKTVWVEIKPYCETVKPKSTASPKTIRTWIKNTCKWQSARMLAKSKNAEFKILTEHELA